MWCGKCQADVAAEVSPDNQRVFCTTCGALLSTIDLPPTRPIANQLGDRTKDARELLQRWSSGQVLDQFGPPIRAPIPSDLANSNTTVRVETTRPAAVVAVPPPPIIAALTAIPTALKAVEASNSAPTSPPLASNAVVERPLPQLTNPLATPNESRPLSVPFANPLTGPSGLTSSPPAAAPTPVVAAPSHLFRVDAAHPAEHFASAKNVAAPALESVGAFAAQPPVVETKREPRRPTFWFPTWDPAVWRSELNTTGSWSSMLGQFLAYAGVLGMTAGCCLVVWSYFGGPENYAPMGWLLATGGQMLLFFGVVTLVSGGLEQTTEQVNKRIEQLGDHIIRIEQAAREISLRGAVPPAHFGLDHDSATQSRSGYERSVVEEQAGR